MTKHSVAVLDDFQNVVRKLADWGRLPRDVAVSVFNDHVEGEVLVRRLTPFDVLVLTRERTPLSRTLIERLPNLKLVVTAGMRNLGIDLVACRERGIPVCGTDSGSTPTAELAWGLIIALARRIPMEDRALREGVWQTPITGFGLRDKTLGIVGLGRLGREMARVGLAFGMKIVAWSQNLTAEKAAEGGAARVDKAELFRISDVVTVHLLMSERSRGIVGRAEIALMRPSAIIVNTSRAAIVDEAALIEALHAGKIGGAGLDVFGREPLPQDAAILKAPNTVLTPHLGYAVHDSYAIYYREALEDVEAWLAGKPVRVISG